MVEQTLRNKSAELEMDSRAACSAPQINPSLYDPPLMQACQYYLNACQQGTSLYNIDWYSNRTNLIIYNTETETREVKILKTSQLLGLNTCITQLPNGKLFCFGDYERSGITVLIDTNGGVEVLPSGAPCRDSSCIYFNNSVYCFGGWIKRSHLTLSSRFDMIRNRWIKLTPMPKDDLRCNSIMFNGNILISGCENRNLLLYSIDIDSFSTIPYEFTEGIIKILINSERPYLIECDCEEWNIYESEIGSYMNWRPIRKTAKIDCSPNQVYCSYNKGAIYIGIDSDYYFKFDLNEKRLIKY